MSMKTVDIESGKSSLVGNEDSSTTSSQRAFLLYEKASLDTPLVHLIKERAPILKEPIRKWYHFRWMMSYPLQKRVPSLGHLMSCLTTVTYGEVILLLPILFFVYFSFKHVFIEPRVMKSGDAAAYPLLFAFLTATKTNSVFAFFCGLPFERMVSYHKLLGYLTIVLGLLHVYVAYWIGSKDPDDTPALQYAHHGNDPNFLKWCVADGTNKSGSAIMLALGGMLLTSYFVIRRKVFECFYFFHIVAAFVIIWYGKKHDVPHIMLVALWWVIDLVIRFLIMASAMYIKKASMRVVSSNVVELSFEKKHFEYNAGQYIWICIPELTMFQWHPFSISSSPDDKNVTLHIKTVGSWTSKLYELAAQQKVNKEVKVLIEGPIGCPSVDLESARYRMVLFVAGGIGVTPLASMHNHLVVNRHDMKKVGFVWSVRETQEGLAPLNEGVIPLPAGFTPNNLKVPSSSVMGCNFKGDGTHFYDFYLTLRKSKIASLLYKSLINPNNIPESTFYRKDKRPNFFNIFKEMKEAAKKAGEKRVAVCVCGPESMILSVQQAVHVYSDRQVYFDLHYEVFEL